MLGNQLISFCVFRYMRRFYKFGYELVALVVVFMLVGAARAQDIDQHRFISGFGKDTNPCILAAPCRTFQRAVSTAPGGGIIVVLDSAEYGEFTVDHAVSIQASPGVYAGILVENQDGVTIAAGSQDRVVLRGLTIHGGRGAASRVGINFRTGGALYIEQCRINGNFLLIRGISTGTNAGTLFVHDTTVRESVAGIIIAGRRALIDSSNFEDNAGDGFGTESGNSIATVINSVSAGNSAGFVSEGELNLEHCVATNNNDVGVQAGTDAIARVSNSVIVDNQIGLSAPTNGQLLSRGNNTIEGNVSNGAFTGTFLAK